MSIKKFQGTAPAAQPLNLALAAGWGNSCPETIGMLINAYVWSLEPSEYSVDFFS